VGLLVCRGFYEPGAAGIVAFMLRSWRAPTVMPRNDRGTHRRTPSERLTDPRSAPTMSISHDVLEGVLSDAKTSHESYTPGCVLDAFDEHSAQRAHALRHSHHAPGRRGPVDRTGERGDRDRRHRHARSPGGWRRAGHDRAQRRSRVDPRRRGDRRRSRATGDERDQRRRRNRPRGGRRSRARRGRRSAGRMRSSAPAPARPAWSGSRRGARSGRWSLCTVAAAPVAPPPLSRVQRGARARPAGPGRPRPWA